MNQPQPLAILTAYPLHKKWVAEAVGIFLLVFCGPGAALAIFRWKYLQPFIPTTA